MSVLMRCLMALMLLGGALTAQEVTPPVESVQEQLGKAPWYDGKQDSWKRVELPQEEPDEAPSGGGGGIPGFTYVMYALVALALVLIAVQLWRQRHALSDLGDADRAVAPPVRFSALPFAVPEGSDDPEAAFAAACAARDWTRAVVWLYAWQLLRIDSAGIVHLVPGKTNRGYLREASARPAIAGPLAATIAIFERAYFGHVGATEAEVQQLIEQHRLLLADLPTLHARAA